MGSRDRPYCSVLVLGATLSAIPFSQLITIGRRPCGEDLACHHSPLNKISRRLLVSEFVQRVVISHVARLWVLFIDSNFFKLPL